MCSIRQVTIKFKHSQKKKASIPFHIFSSVLSVSSVVQILFALFCRSVIVCFHIQMCCIRQMTIKFKHSQKKPGIHTFSHLFPLCSLWFKSFFALICRSVIVCFHIRMRHVHQMTIKFKHSQKQNQTSIPFHIPFLCALCVLCGSNSFFVLLFVSQKVFISLSNMFYPSSDDKI